MRDTGARGCKRLIDYILEYNLSCLSMNHLMCYAPPAGPLSGAVGERLAYGYLATSCSSINL